MSDLKVGDKVKFITSGTEAIITAVGETCLLVRLSRGEECWHKTHCRVVPTTPAAPPVPELPACGYWKHGDVMLHNPVWRKCDAIKDYWFTAFGNGEINKPGNVNQSTLDVYANGYRYCLSVLTPPQVPACGYWERGGKRYKLAEPIEYRFPKKDDIYLHEQSQDRFRWILREVPSVRRWTERVTACGPMLSQRAMVQVPLIDDGPGTVARLDHDTIGREYMIARLTKESADNPIARMIWSQVIDELRAEQEAAK